MDLSAKDTGNNNINKKLLIMITILIIIIIIIIIIERSLLKVLYWVYALFSLNTLFIWNIKQAYKQQKRWKEIQIMWYKAFVRVSFGFLKVKIWTSY